MEINLRYSCYLQQRCNFEEIAHNELNIICYAIDSCIVLCTLNFHRVDIYGYDMVAPAVPVPDLKSNFLIYLRSRCCIESNTLTTAKMLKNLRAVYTLKILGHGPLESKIFSWWKMLRLFPFTLQ
jgi:hypothetical protein